MASLGTDQQASVLLLTVKPEIESLFLSVSPRSQVPKPWELNIKANPQTLEAFLASCLKTDS